MEIQPKVWTYVGDTLVELKYDGDEVQTVAIDEQGAVVLPSVSEDEMSGAAFLWEMRPGNVPVTRAGQPFDLDRPEFWPGGFTLVDGKWKKIVE
jgi:hypothetical protein